MEEARTIVYSIHFVSLIYRCEETSQNGTSTYGFTPSFDGQSPPQVCGESFSPFKKLSQKITKISNMYLLIFLSVEND